MHYEAIISLLLFQKNMSLILRSVAVTVLPQAVRLLDETSLFLF